MELFAGGDPGAASAARVGWAAVARVAAVAWAAAVGWWAQVEWDKKMQEIGGKCNRFESALLPEVRRRHNSADTSKDSLPPRGIAAVLSDLD